MLRGDQLRGVVVVDMDRKWTAVGDEDEDRARRPMARGENGKVSTWAWRLVMQSGCIDIRHVLYMYLT